MTLFEMTTIIAAVIVISMLIMIMVILSCTCTLLHFKNRKERALEPRPAPDVTVAPLQTSPQAASNVELMEVEENAADASSIIPKENVAYGTNQRKK